MEDDNNKIVSIGDYVRKSEEEIKQADKKKFEKQKEESERKKQNEQVLRSYQLGKFGRNKV